jgi:LysM repeat protein
MTTYTVVKGDTLFGISKKFKTTIDIIKADNSIIKNVNDIQVGWKLTIRTPQEVSAAKAAKAKAAQTQAAQKKSTAQASTPTAQTKATQGKVMWDNAEVTPGQVGRVVILKALNLVSMSSTGGFTHLNIVKPPEKYRVLEIKNLSGAILIDGGSYLYSKLYRVAVNAWVPNVDTYIRFEDLPASVKNQVEVGKVKQTNAPPVEDFMSPTIPFYEPVGHRRPVLQVKKNNKILTMEMRIVNASGSYSTQIQQNKTNGGWLINISGSQLPVQTLSGVFLDTKTNREFDDFMARYRQYLTAYRDGDYYSSAICTLYYKGREYKGLIAAFNYSDQETEQLLRRFSMQFVILKEKGPEDGTITAPNIVKNSPSIDDYFGDIRYLLLNPLTGKYGND